MYQIASVFRIIQYIIFYLNYNIDKIIILRTEGFMYCIFSFKSRQEAMRLFDSAKRAGVFVSIISTPKFVNSGCGLSVKTDIGEYKALYNVFVEMQFSSFLGAFKVSNDRIEMHSERIL